MLFTILHLDHDTRGTGFVAYVLSGRLCAHVINTMSALLCHPRVVFRVKTSKNRFRQPLAHLHCIAYAPLRYEYFSRLKRKSKLSGIVCFVRAFKLGFGLFAPVTLFIWLWFTSLCCDPKLSHRAKFVGLILFVSVAVVSSRDERLRICGQHKTGLRPLVSLWTSSTCWQVENAKSAEKTSNVYESDPNAGDRLRVLENIRTMSVTTC